MPNPTTTYTVLATRVTPGGREASKTFTTQDPDEAHRVAMNYRKGRHRWEIQILKAPTRPTTYPIHEGDTTP